MPESRRKMIERGNLFGVPAYRWLPAKGRATTHYSASSPPQMQFPMRCSRIQSGG